MQDGRWIKADTAEFGSYLTFDVAGTEADIAAVSVISIWRLWGLVALAIVLAAVIVLVSVKKRRAETRVIILTMLLNDNELLLLSQNITLDFELKTLSLSKNRPENQSIYALFLII